MEVNLSLFKFMSSFFHSSAFLLSELQMSQGEDESSAYSGFQVTIPPSDFFFLFFSWGICGDYRNSSQAIILKGDAHTQNMMKLSYQGAESFCVSHI